MPNTFSQIYLQFVFAVQGRQSVIQKEHKEELHQYITSLVQARRAKMLTIHCLPDHIHLFASIKRIVFIPDFVKEIKVKSNEFIKSKRWTKGTSSWQEACLAGRQGYGVFSYGHSQTDVVCWYVLNQEQHHKKKTFKEEYHEFLRKFEVPYEEKYLFEFPE